MSRYARKVDDNQEEVVRGLRAAGCWVWSTAQLGNGFPDLLVYSGGKFHLLELKDGRKVPSQRRLTDAEVAFADSCPGPVPVVKSLAEALQAVGVFGKQARP